MDTYNLFLIDIENVGYSGIEELSEVLEYVDADLYVAYYYMGVSKTAINYLNEIGAVIDEISGNDVLHRFKRWFPFRFTLRFNLV